MNPAELFRQESRILGIGAGDFLFREGKAYHFGMNGATLRQLKKSDERKLAIARVIRRGAAVGNGWITRKLELGYATAVSWCLKQNSRERPIRGETACRF